LRKIIETPLHGILEETNEIDFEQFEKCLNIIFMTLSLSEKYFLLNVKNNIKDSKHIKFKQNNYNSPLQNIKKQKELNDYLANNKHVIMSSFWK